MRRNVARKTKYYTSRLERFASLGTLHAGSQVHWCFGALVPFTGARVLRFRSRLHGAGSQVCRSI